MNRIFGKLFWIFYREETKSSRAQLAEDFKAYPPTPLESCREDVQFKVVSVRGIGELYNIAKMVGRIWRVPDAELEAVCLSSESGQAKIALLEGRRAYRALQTQYKHNPILLSIAGWLLGPVLLAGWVKGGGVNPDSRGYFTSMPGADDQITVKIGFSKTEISTEAVLSHEHIHLLQYMNGVNDGRGVADLASSVDYERVSEKAISYLMKDVEVEARLHEIMLSYYRACNALPMDVESFLNALCMCRQIGWLIQNALEAQGERRNIEIFEYDARSEAIANQFGLLIWALKGDYLRYRFITEVLTVMYGNLLGYYGDSKAATNFLNKIKRPNLYDELYYKE